MDVLIIAIIVMSALAVLISIVTFIITIGNVRMARRIAKLRDQNAKL